ncbi:MAG TPA: SRPBCC domain-containing protein [Chitinophagaceae bacterium]|nr:SRPBCC domain-containing protein [Chitinophagaceae bacterium]
MMNGQAYHTSITVAAGTHEAFDRICNVTAWWTENLEGSTQQLNDEFAVRFGDVHFSRQKLIEVMPGKKLVWLVTDSNLNFIANRQEWTNTKICFELVELGDKTRIEFTHIGLLPAVECYDACSNAWSQYLHQSLLNLINTGVGMPTLK